MARVKAALDSGSDVNTRNADVGFTALTLASEAGEIDVVKFLLSEHANVSATDYYGRTAINYAIMGRKMNCVKLLASMGASVNFKDSLARWIVSSGVGLIIRWLIRRNALKKMAAATTAPDVDANAWPPAPTP